MLAILPVIRVALWSADLARCVCQVRLRLCHGIDYHHLVSVPPQTFVAIGQFHVVGHVLLEDRHPGLTRRRESQDRG